MNLNIKNTGGKNTKTHILIFLLQEGSSDDSESFLFFLATGFSTKQNVVISLYSSVLQFQVYKKL